MAKPKSKARARTAAKRTRAKVTARKRAVRKASDLKLSFGCGPYDRMEALWTGEVKPEGIDLAFTRVEVPHRLFDMVLDEGLFDAAEFGISTSIAQAAKGEGGFAAIPVFPSKMFRHSYIFVNRRAGIREPKDLEGRRIGVPIYTQVAAIWIRGHLAREFGVDLSGVTWVQGAIDRPGPHGSGLRRPELHKPFTIENSPAGRSLDSMLVAGEIDALIGATRPPSLGRHPDVVRLFSDYRAVERDFYARTGIHPIMHDVVVRQAIHDKHPWAAASLYRACEAARARAIEKLHYGGAQRVMLPWLASEVEETDALFGDKLWSYGIEANRKTIETLIDLMFDQGVIANKVRVEDVFVPIA